MDEPEFFPDDDFVDPERRGVFSHPATQTFKYLPDDPLREQPPLPLPGHPFELVGTGDSTFRLTPRKERRGSGGFRKMIRNAYGGACCISGEPSDEVLEAAHIEPYVNEDSNHAQNGLLLRVDLHRLFDAGLLTLDDDYRVLVSERLASSQYRTFDGQRINLPTDEAQRPSLAAVRRHRAVKSRKEP